MLQFKILTKFSLYILLTFIAFTVIGTLSHEYGHIAVAEFLGYDTKLNYGSMNYYQKGYLESQEYKELNELDKKYNRIRGFDSLDETVKEEYYQLFDRIHEKFPINNTHKLWVLIGGPTQTLLTSFIGLSMLFFRRTRERFKLIDWLAVFLSLFCLREVFNFLNALLFNILYGKSNFNGDEFRISRLLGYNEWLIPTIVFILGLVVSLYVILNIIPLKYQLSFIIAGLLGGLSGFGIWFGFLGEALFN